MEPPEEPRKIPEIPVERLPYPDESPGEGGGSAERGFRERARDALDPIAAGVLVDVLDALSAGVLTPLGLVLGIPLGWWLGTRAGLPGRHALRLGLGIGVYCVLPFTGVLPLGTLVGVYLRFFREPPAPDEAS